jgi:thiol-disulfide isomerase/thioredoxin
VLWRQVVSQSPVAPDELDAARDTQSAYRRSLAHMNQLLRDGGSLSGEEANCAFLNLHGQPFATVSSVTGFDFLDDARAIALTDWDHDGDMDAWVTNRTAPRIRFLRNDVPSGNHFLALQLVGHTVNRDAIGARVEVHQAGWSTPQSRSLRAGEGFLAQSSKWLTLGIGPSTAAVDVTVYWPDGQVQSWKNISVDRHYLVTQGNNELQRWQRPAATLRIAPGELPSESATDAARVVLSSRLPLPPIRFRQTASSDETNGDEELFGKQSQPTLVNLWASWCGPCLEELQEFTQRADELRAAGVDIVALAVDQAVPDRPVTKLNAEQIMARLKPSLTCGQLTVEGLSRLRSLHEMPFGIDIDLPVPVSFLVDQQGQIAVVYRGKVSLDEVLEDVKQLDRWAGQSSSAGLPVPGRWNEEMPSSIALSVVRDVAEQGGLADARRMVTQQRDLLGAQQDFDKLLAWLAARLLADSQSAEGISLLRSALELAPNDLTPLNNLAWQLATHPDSTIRQPTESIRHAEHAVRLSQGRSAGILDTLAACYAAAGRFDAAVKAAERARQLAVADGNQELAARIEQRLSQYKSRQPFVQPAK